MLHNNLSHVLQLGGWLGSDHHGLQITQRSVQLGKHVRLYLTCLTIDVQTQNPIISCPLAVKVHIIMLCNYFTGCESMRG